MLKTNHVGKLSSDSSEHQAVVCAALTQEERSNLAALCRRIVAQQELAPDVHPGNCNSFQRCGLAQRVIAASSQRVVRWPLRATPGVMPMIRLNVRLKAASDV